MRSCRILFNWLLTYDQSSLALYLSITNGNAFSSTYNGRIVEGSGAWKNNYANERLNQQMNIHLSGEDSFSPMFHMYLSMVGPDRCLMRSWREKTNTKSKHRCQNNSLYWFSRWFISKSIFSTFQSCVFVILRATSKGKWKKNVNSFEFRSILERRPSLPHDHNFS